MSEPIIDQVRRLKKERAELATRLENVRGVLADRFDDLNPQQQARLRALYEREGWQQPKSFDEKTDEELIDEVEAMHFRVKAIVYSILIGVPVLLFLGALLYALA